MISTVVSLTIILISSVSTSYAQFPEAQFKERIQQFSEFATPRVIERGLRFQVILDEDWTTNIGSCTVEDGSFNVYLGAKAYENENLQASFLDVMLCHELGHLLGEGPRKVNYLNNSGDWAAGEGESDYFAGSCVRQLRAKFPLVSAGFLHAFHSAEGFFQYLQKPFQVLTGARPPQLGRFDRSIAKFKMLDYPSHQCRLDSFVNGYLNQPRPECWTGRE